MLAMLGPRINRLRVMPKRIVERQDPTHGFWHRWAQIVVRRPIPVAVVGIAIVAILLVPGLQINPAEAQLKDYPGSGDAIQGRDGLARAGISPGVMKPYVVLIENGGPGATSKVVGAVRRTPGIAAAVGPRPGGPHREALRPAFPTPGSGPNASLSD